MTEQKEPLYLIASLKHTNKGHEHITFWAPESNGYVLAITDERVGKYTQAQATFLNDGIDCLAIPEDAVKAILSPSPFYAGSNGIARPFYDTKGPVADNTRANWNRLIAASMTRGRLAKPKPEFYRGARRSFSIEDITK